MGSLVITGPNGKPFPNGCEVRVESMPGWEIQYIGEASGTLTLQVSPGKYQWSIAKAGKGVHPGGGPFISYREFGSAFHEITEEQWHKLSVYEPKLARPRQTSQGVRWLCGYFGCSEITTSRIGAIEHEAQHFGHSLLEHVDEAETAMNKAEDRRVAQSRAKEDANKTRQAQGLAPL